MTIFDQTSNDLKASRLVMHKLGETFTDFKIRSFSMISLCEQWQTLQGSFTKIHNSLEKRVKEVEAKERECDVSKNRLQNILKEVELRQKKLDSDEKVLSERSEFVGLREKEVREWRESLELEKKRNVEGFERVKEMLKAVEERERVVKDNVEEMDLRAKVMSERGEVLDVKEKELDEMYFALEKENNEKSGLLMSKEKVLGLKEKDIDERCQVLEAKEKEMLEGVKAMELKQKEIDERSGLLEGKEKKMLEDAKAMELERKQMDERLRLVELNEKEIEERFVAMQAKGVIVRDDSQINESNKGLDAKEIKLDDQLDGLLEEQPDEHRVLSDCQAQEFEEKHSESSSLKNVRQELPDSENQQEVTCSKDTSLSNIVSHRTHSYYSDPLFAKFYSMDHMKENGVSPEEILDALRCSPDPGKLVFGITRLFHRNFSDKDTTTIYKDSCILLSEQLMKLSPPIMDNVKEEARDLAITLKAAKGRTPTDNFGFLQFIAAFKLADCFDADDLLSMFGSLYGGPKVYRHEQQAVLCSALGLSDKIPGLIHSYIERNKLLTAVKCICVFKLEHLYSPVPLLECYLDLSRKRVNQKRKEGAFRFEYEAENMELAILRDVTSCIATFKLESKFPPDSLLLRIKQVYKKRKFRKVASKNQNNKRSPSSCDSVDRIPHKSLLCNRHIIDNSNCPRCISNVEDPIHTLRDCPLSTAVWDLTQAMDNDLLQARNKLVFQNEPFPSPQTILYLATSQAREFRLAKGVDTSTPIQSIHVDPIHSPHFHMLHVDASFVKVGEPAAVAGRGAKPSS
ncbi:FRIGIDA-like protein 5 [Chenopodium quinoa]|uniref:FRIGIDA-like protein 5 n=1 Tax=Chenopodium quinoa TaxID=63459 RepID=UPI000B785A7B|nr:FRIGIDA-like protein 5 [Chenopodium quinoa]